MGCYLGVRLASAIAIVKCSIPHCLLLVIRCYSHLEIQLPESVQNVHLRLFLFFSLNSVWSCHRSLQNGDCYYARCIRQESVLLIVAIFAAFYVLYHAGVETPFLVFNLFYMLSGRNHYDSVLDTMLDPCRYSADHSP